MSKLKNPLLSLGAVGRLAKVLSFKRRLSADIVEKTPVVPDAKTLAQLSWRTMYQKAVALWHALSAEEKQEWESLARAKHMTGYAYFLSQALKPNPGLYLPLQGGTMAGNIDMAKNRLLNLPEPTDDQEAARKIDLVGVGNFLALTDTPASYAGQALKGVRVNATTNALEFATIVAGATLTIAETEVFSGTTPGAWTDLDLSAVVGTNPALVLLKFTDTHATYDMTCAVRRNGDTDEFYGNISTAMGCALGVGKKTSITSIVLLVATDASGIIEWRSTGYTGTLDIIAYIK